MMKAYSVIAKGIGELHGKRTQSAVLSSQWCVKELQQLVRSGYCVQNNEKPRRSDFQVCSLGSIEHVDRFVGMAGTPSSFKN